MSWVDKAKGMLSGTQREPLTLVPERELGDLGETLTGIEARLTSVETKLEAVEEDLAPFREQDRNGQSFIQRFEAFDKSVGRTLGTLAERIGKLEKNVVPVLAEVSDELKAAKASRQKQDAVLSGLEVWLKMGGYLVKNGGADGQRDTGDD